ncbi:ATP-binding protein [Fluoribacter dumoffii]|uniref:histidine kinase n=1 Tax=Fluoribacter dumoffii TaxID=463 RepID=A0A377GD80_9GAMM|nr:PAS domain-containing sensor histidine kinase [Fluoribacter dumoffii]KTC91100.1 sensor histidine kinase [Fluoribacter dumoffii NY 23]MCW8387732.1 ATP-binding protein [Fluoribacter dumoffii]MCW8416709.1 ATP-binding protein [Fluoribacter dumoffii]MCW8455451.1 ATP-binding protein [Fluoribacter dumoffii]MCW8460471.1 ATP-binding protein [Fluoribacter dumoffii]
MINSKIPINLKKKHAEDLLANTLTYEISRDYLMELLDIGKLNVWQWDLSTNETIDFGYSESLSVLNPDSEVGHIDHFITRLHPEDREEVANKLIESLAYFEDPKADFRIQSRKGTYEWVSARGRYIRDAENNAIKMIGTWHFITEQKKNQELIKLQQTTLDRISRCYFSGDSACSLSHEIAQPLLALNSYLLGSILRLQQENKESHEFIAVLQKALEQVELINSIIKRMKRFVTHGELHFERVNLGLLAKQSVVLSKFYSHFTGTVHYEIDEDLTEVTLDRNQMRQVFLNLINNAFEAMLDAHTKNPLLLIKIEKIDSEIWVSIIDNGPGVAQNVLDNLFSSCFSTKEYGLGLGLSICRKIIEAHGGSLKIEKNTLGGGTVSSFRLPNQISGPK